MANLQTVARLTGCHITVLSCIFTKTNSKNKNHEIETTSDLKPTAKLQEVLSKKIVCTFKKPSLCFF